MGRYTGPNCRLCRKENTKLFLKGHKCNTEKCSFTKRPTPPGMHTRISSKPSYYALQLREKQKAKRIYGMMEEQFRRFFRMATKAKGSTGAKLLELLERRIDNVIYRGLFSHSRKQARQIVSHGFIFINTKRVNIPSRIIKENDEITVKAHATFIQELKNTIDFNTKERSVPSWLILDKDNLKIKVSRLPQREDLNIAINDQLIVELYSK